MLALRVAEHLDVVEHVLPCLLASSVGPTPDPLALEQVEEALGNRIVVVDPAAAHRVLQMWARRNAAQSMLVNWLPLSE